MSYTEWKDKTADFKTVDVRGVAGNFFPGLKKQAMQIPVGSAAERKLPEISPKFKMLSTHMGKIMLGKADIAMMSEKSGLDADEIISGIKKLIGE